jgi:uncharacterized protein (TIGR02001 family)
LTGRRHSLAGLLPALTILCLAAPAAAEIGASFSVQSDARFRGRSLSRGRPTASLALSYDAPGGFYLGAAASGVATAHSSIRFLGIDANAGFAHRLASGPTLDVGVEHYRYTEYYSSGRKARYTEIYVGLIGRNLSSHLYYSPSYFGLGFSTVYGEVDGLIRVGDTWRVNGHFGVIARVDGDRKPGYDWRIGVAAELRPFDVQVAVGGGGPMPQYYGGRPHSREALTVGITYVF